MRQIIFISLFGIIVGGCSVLRQGSNKVSENPALTFSDDVVESVIKQNITNSGFFIQKAELELSTVNGKEKFIATVKFRSPDKYLISIRGRSGIEGARIYISDDSILINDRVNRKLYFGNSYYVYRKYGLTLNILPVVFGDLILESSCKKNIGKCDGDITEIECGINGLAVKYEINCAKRKTTFVKQTDNGKGEGFRIGYKNFRRIKEIMTPRIIELEDEFYNTKVKIRVLKLESPWNGDLKFVPGKGYEIIKLI